MSQNSPVRFWFGRTAHVRETPYRRAFHQTIRLIDLDIDQLETANKMSPLFTVDGFNLVSFHKRDHGPRDGSSLREWAEQRFSEADVSLGGGRIRLVTFPRVLGYGFSPLSLWYGYDADDELRGVIYEVHNTFGEAHSYVGAISQERSDRLTQTSPKHFHVSPFFDISGAYHFKLKQPNDKLSVIVENIFRKEIGYLTD